MKANSLVVATMSLLIIFGGIFVADAFGLWQTESTKEPSRFTEGEFEGESNPDDIRGSYSFGDIESIFGVPASLMAQAFGLETDDPSALKANGVEAFYGDLGEDIELGTGSVKKFVALYTGLPYEGEDYLPESAIDLLKAEGKWTDAMALSLEGFILYDTATSVIDASETDKGVTDEVPLKEEEDHEQEPGIRGQTSVADVISYGVSLDTVEAIMGIDISNEHMLIRDLCDQNGLNFSDIKNALGAELEAME